MPVTISATIEIAATPERVWAVLADLASYSQWHPFFRGVSGQLSPGSTIAITTTHPTTDRAMTVKVKVLTVEPATELRWQSNVLGLMRNTRSFSLSPITGGTELAQSETYYQGLLVRFPAKTLTRIQDSFEAINQAIKRQAESRPD